MFLNLLFGLVLQFVLKKEPIVGFGSSSGANFIVFHQEFADNTPN